MLKLRKALYSGLVLILLNTMVWAGESSVHVYSFLHKGGELRMLTMRVLQEYAMVGMKNHYKNPQEALQKDMQTLEDGLQMLIESLKDDESKEDFSQASLLKAQQGIQEAKKLLGQAPSERSAMEFWKALDQVRDGLNRSLVHLSQMVYPDDDVVQGIMYANRLSTIAQRFGALYLYKVWGFGEELHAKEQLAFLNQFFPDTIENVQESAEELPEKEQKEVQKLLDGVKRNLSFFAIMGKSSRRFVPTLIYSKSEKIANSAGKIAEIFEKQAPKEE